MFGFANDSLDGRAGVICSPVLPDGTPCTRVNTMTITDDIRIYG